MTNLVDRAGAGPTYSTTYEHFAGWCAILTGIVVFLYSVAFIVISRSAPALGDLLSALFLMLAGVLSSAALVGVYGRLRETDAGFALWGLLLGLAGALGSAIHGSYDLANAINPPAVNPASAANLPSQIDPRGLATFGLAGLALLVVAWLIRRGGRLPDRLGMLGYLFGALLIVVYLGRLIVLAPANPLLLVPAVLAGFVVNPIWYIWLGLALRRPRTE